MREAAFRNAVHLLLVDGDPEDVALLRSVLEHSRLLKTLHVVESGEEALRFLRRQPPYEQAPRPKLILLDLRLPGISGLDVLKALKKDAALRPIPVLILAVSNDEDELLAAYDERACAFIPTPPDRDAFETAIRGIEAFWLETAQLPMS